MKRVYIQTFGCQMNEYDSEQMLQVLATKGFEATSNPQDAQLLIINSCSVREKSENKALSSMGRFQLLKKEDPSKVLAFGGCVGQTEGDKLKHQFPFLDFVFGTNNYRDLPKMIESYENRWQETLDETEVLLPSSRPDSRCQAFITITNGCDKFCSYCIVPFTRGREFSRAPEEILLEAQKLVERGVKEIMLLGQNVNSYWGKDERGTPTSLYQLLQRFQSETSTRLKGLERLRYTTSHPRDFDENLARAFQELPILCEYLHLPFQSGSDQILRRMRRFYTAETFLKKMELVKRYRPDIALSTDIIVGFPGETREDFEQTVNILKTVEFDNVYAFKYSQRPYTKAAEWKDDVSESEKSDRFQELMAIQKKICAKKYAEDLHQNVELMMEGISKSNPMFWTGRTRKNRVVHLPTDPRFFLGQILTARIKETTHSWMSGDLVSEPLQLAS